MLYVCVDQRLFVSLMNSVLLSTVWCGIS